MCGHQCELVQCKQILKTNAQVYLAAMLYIRTMLLNLIISHCSRHIDLSTSNLLACVAPGPGHAYSAVTNAWAYYSSEDEPMGGNLEEFAPAPSKAHCMAYDMHTCAECETCCLCPT